MSIAGTFLQIVGSKHDNDQIERPVTFQKRRKHLQSVLVDPFDRIIMRGGATGVPFLYDGPVLPEPGRHLTGPPDVGVEPPGIHRVAQRAGAVGIAVSETQGCSHDRIYPNRLPLSASNTW